MTVLHLGSIEMQEQEADLTAEMAVETGFEYFEKFVARGNKLQDVLLEGLEPIDDGWIVSIGFNGTRDQVTEPAVSGVTALGVFGKKTTTVVREIRHIYLDKYGNFKKLN